MNPWWESEEGRKVDLFKFPGFWSSICWLLLACRPFPLSSNLLMLVAKKSKYLQKWPPRLQRKQLSEQLFLSVLRRRLLEGLQVFPHSVFGGLHWKHKQASVTQSLQPSCEDESVCRNYLKWCFVLYPLSILAGLTQLTGLTCIWHILFFLFLQDVAVCVPVAAGSLGSGSSGWNDSGPPVGRVEAHTQEGIQWPGECLQKEASTMWNEIKNVLTCSGERNEDTGRICPQEVIVW